MTPIAKDCEAARLSAADSAYEYPGAVTARPSATANKIAICGGQSQRCVSSASAPPRKNSASSVTSNNSRCARHGVGVAAARTRSVSSQLSPTPVAKAMIWLERSDKPAAMSTQKTSTSTSGATALRMRGTIGLLGYGEDARVVAARVAEAGCCDSA